MSVYIRKKLFQQSYICYEIKYMDKSHVCMTSFRSPNIVYVMLAKCDTNFLSV